jgi:nitronate monooxygenase
LTGRPFGVGFISTQRVPGSSDRTVDDLQAIALDEGVRIVMHSFMVPAHLVAEARRRGARVICQVQTVAMAKEAVEAGADVLIAQGFDGGGHVGSIGTMSIVPAVIDVAGDRPVLAAGGIADGRGLAAALMLGAQGANIGTRFFASAEAIIPDYARERLVEASTDDTVWTRTYDLIRDLDFGPTVALRLLRTAFTDTWEGRAAEAQANATRLIAEIDEAWERGLPTARVLAGSAVGLVRDVEPAGAIVRGICAEAEQIIRSRSAALLA